MRFTAIIDGREIKLRTISDYSINEWAKYLKQREGFMGFRDPDVGKSDGNLTDVFAEGEPFELHGLDVVKARTDYGEGEMVIATVNTPDGRKRLSIWGAYLVAQAKSAEPSDFPATVRIVRGPVEGFSDRPDTKRFE